MSSSLKLMQRLPNRSIISKLSLSSHRYISFSRCHPSTRTSLSQHNHQCGPSCRHHHHHHHRAHGFSTASQEKTDEAKAEDENNESVEESESEEESDNESKISELESTISSLNAEVSKYRDALVRRSADILNLQNMNKKDVENAKKFAVSKFSKDMLNVADALSGCLGVVDEHTQGGKELPSAEVQSVIEGVRITHSTLIDTFARHDIIPIKALGEEFDPNFHEALFKMPSEDYPNDTVVQVVAEGYTIKDAVLRAAKVGVSTAPPTPVTPQTDEESVEEEQEVSGDSDGEKKD